MIKEAFLGHNWEDIRLKIPKGKFRVVMLDFWDYTATVMGDFNTLEDAQDYLKELTSLAPPDSYIEFVIYNDRGEAINPLNFG